MTQISEAAKQALLSTGTNRQGAVPTHPMTQAVRQELEAAKLIGTSGGLTRRGTIARERLADAALPF